MVGDTRKLLRHRYGRRLPDDDAGRDDIRVLLHPVAAAPGKADEKMRFEISEWAPWMSAEEIEETIAEVKEMDPWRYGAETAMATGIRLNLTAAERERLQCWQIGAADHTEADREAQRKAKRRQRVTSRRREVGVRPRQEFLATSLSKSKPWEAEGIGRRTWYRHRGTGPCPIKSNSHGTDLCHGPLATKPMPTSARRPGQVAPASPPLAGHRQVPRR